MYRFGFLDYCQGLSDIIVLIDNIDTAMLTSLSASWLIPVSTPIKACIKKATKGISKQIITENSRNQDQAQLKHSFIPITKLSHAHPVHTTHQSINQCSYAHVHVLVHDHDPHAHHQSKKQQTEYSPCHPADDRLPVRYQRTYQG